MRGAWLLVALASCQADNSPIMFPGSNCLSCHQAGGAADSRIWTLAGTVFNDPQATVREGVENAQVLVTDTAGKELTLLTNLAGNFYTAEALTFPVQVSVQKGNTRIGMDGHPAIGACYTCHNDPRSNEAIGRIFFKGP